MLEYLHLKNVALASELRVDFSPRFNILAGDNGLGKSFILDLAWWALTRTWAGSIALPDSTQKATIEYKVQGKVMKKQKPVISNFRRDDESWQVAQARPSIPGIVIYIRIDGGFSVWDPARNYWRKDPGRPDAYHFTSADVWNGLDIAEQRACEGLERDWVSWQEGRKEQFKALESVLNALSPVSEKLKAGPPKRLFLGEGRDRPTLLIGKQVIPVALASAGIRRVLALSYFLVWAWHEHRVASELLGKTPESRFIILFDEPETHLHPRWQRVIIPSLLSAVNTLRGATGSPPQVMLATHAPLVIASLEPVFDPAQDDLIHLDIDEGEVVVQQDRWAKQGDVTNWLVSNTFGLKQARSADAERAIEAAERFMRGEKLLANGLRTKTEIHVELQRLLPPHDVFWARWLVDTELFGKNGRRKR